MILASYLSSVAGVTSSLRGDRHDSPRWNNDEGMRPREVRMNDMMGI